MIARTPRFTLAVCAALLLLGSAAHAAAFSGALPIIGTSGLPRFYSGSFKGLWLGDSSTLFLLGAIFALIAARPAAVTRPVVLLLALIPAAIATFIYVFVGGFYAGHLLMVIAALAFLAGTRWPSADHPTRG